MRKVTAIVCYHGTTIKAITVVNAKNLFVQLGSGYDIEKKFSTFNKAYEYVLKLLKMNNFELNHYSDFGCEWYDIIWYDSSNPTRHQRFGYIPPITKE